MDKTYKALIFIDNQSSYQDINGNMIGILPAIWVYIKKKLQKKKYKIEEIIVNQLNFKEGLRELTENKYDIIIAEYWILPFRRTKYVTFTEKILLNTPVIMYDTNTETSINKLEYTKNFIKRWIFPFVLIILFSFIFGLINNIIIGNNIYKNIIYFNYLLVGSKNYLLNNVKNNLLYKSLMLLFAYFFYIFIIAYIIRNRIKNDKKIRLIENNISGMKFFVETGSYSVQILKDYNAIPIEVPNPWHSYERNKFNNRSIYNGFIFSSLNLGHINSKLDSIDTSNIIKKWLPVGFPVNKKNKLFLKEINIIIKELKLSGEIYKTCRLSGNNPEIKC